MGFIIDAANKEKDACKFAIGCAKWNAIGDNPLGDDGFAQGVFNWVVWVRNGNAPCKRSAGDAFSFDQCSVDCCGVINLPRLFSKGHEFF